MCNRWILFTGALAALVVAGSAAAGPLKVGIAGAKSQTVAMCPDCKSQAACAQVGDIRIGFAVDLENSKFGIGAISVHVQDRDKKPITTADVSVTLSMPEHKHGLAPQAAKHSGHGRYAARTQQLVMSGYWKAEVEVRLANGDIVRQAFTFYR